jgi:hypothetical protein
VFDDTRELMNTPPEADEGWLYYGIPGAAHGDVHIVGFRRGVQVNVWDMRDIGGKETWCLVKKFYTEL